MDDALILQQIADGRLLINTHYTTINKGQSSKLTATFTANAKMKHDQIIRITLLG